MSGTSLSFRLVTGCLDAVIAGYDVDLEAGKVQVVFRESAHTMAITCTAQGGRYLASGSNDEKIWLWDVKKRITLGELLEHQAEITWVGFRDKYFVSCDAQGKIVVFRTKDWEPVARMKAKAGVNGFAIHPKGVIALSVDRSRHLMLWNMMTARKAGKIRLEQEALQVAWHPSGEEYAVMFARGVSTFGVSGDQLSSVAMDCPCKCMAYVSVGDRILLAVGCEDGAVQLCAGGALVKRALLHKSRVKSMVPVAGKFLCSLSSDGTIVFYDLEKEEISLSYATNDRLTCCVAMDKSLEAPRDEVPAEKSDYGDSS